MRGQQEYKMRMQGMAWTDIAAEVGVKPNSAYSRAQAFAQENNLSLSIKKYQKRSRTRRRRAQKGDGARWHKMHCGQGMRAPDIALVENIDVEIVRDTLQAYREKMWGSTDE